MKQKDVVLIIVVAFISGVVSIVGSKYLINTPKNRQQTVEVVEKISSELKTPSNKYYNENSTNPTKQITIGTPGDQQEPFKPSQ